VQGTPGGWLEVLRRLPARRIAVSTLPTGTVTFVFTDIEGSTRLLAQLGDRYAEILAAYRLSLRKTFGGFGGHEVGVEGDSLFYAFPRAKDAFAAALAGQRSITSHAWPLDTRLLVRMGVHTGEPLAVAAGYIGLDVHLASKRSHHRINIASVLGERAPGPGGVRTRRKSVCRDLARVGGRLAEVVAGAVPGRM